MSRELSPKTFVDVQGVSSFPSRVNAPLLPLASCCLSSSEVEVPEEEPHLRLTVLGMLQLSRYLQEGGRGEVSQGVGAGVLIAGERNQGRSPDDAVQAVDLLVGVARVSLLLDQRRRRQRAGRLHRFRYQTSDWVAGNRCDVCWT